MFIIQRYIAQKKLAELLKKDEDDTEKPGATRKSSLEKEDDLNQEPGLRKKSHSCENLSSLNRVDIDWLLNSLKPAELQALRRSWQHMGSKHNYDKFVKLMVTVFDRAGQKEPKINTLLSMTDGASGEATSTYIHAKTLTGLLDSTIRPTGRLTSCATPTIIGKLHGPLSTCGFAPEYWERFGQSFSEVMAKNDIVRATGGHKAWNIIIAVLTDRLRAAFEQSAKQFASKQGVPRITVTELEAMKSEDKIWRQNEKKMGIGQTANLETYHRRQTGSTENQAKPRIRSRSMRQTPTRQRSLCNSPTGLTEPETKLTVRTGSPRQKPAYERSLSSTTNELESENKSPRLRASSMRMRKKSRQFSAPD